MTRSCPAALVAVLVAAGQASAQAPSTSPVPGGEYFQPPVEPSANPGSVTARATAVTGVRDSADAGSLKGIRAVSTATDEAVIVLDAVTRTVRPGDLIGADLVRSIAPGRIVLHRPAAPLGGGGEADVVVDFDGSGRGRVRVYATRDATSRPTPEVR